MVGPAFLLVGLLGILLTNMALIGNLARVQRKFLFFELDSFLILVVYFGGLGLLYLRAIGT